jgi:hypothetical protein
MLEYLKALHSPSSRDLQPGSRSSLLKKWCNNNCFYVCLVLGSEDFCVLCALHVWGVSPTVFLPLHPIEPSSIECHCAVL